MSLVNPRTGGKSFSPIFVIATGSHSWAPSIDGLNSVPSYTNETIFDLWERPDHLLIIGGGPTGIEMAQAHCRLGCKVTVIEAFTIMGRDDPDLVKRLKKQLREEQIVLIEKTKIIRISKQTKSICIELADGHSVQGSHLLIPLVGTNLEGLCLDAAKIDFTTKGITTDKTAPRKNICLPLAM